jgi:hypothetical protein
MPAAEAEAACKNAPDVIVAGLDPRLRWWALRPRSAARPIKSGKSPREIQPTDDHSSTQGRKHSVPSLPVNSLAFFLTPLVLQGLLHPLLEFVFA